MRRLLVCVRPVPAARRAAYDVVWSDVAGAVHEAGGRAWRFVSVTDSARFVEFVEWQDDQTRPPLPDQAAITKAGVRLEDAFPSSSRELLNECRS